MLMSPEDINDGFIMAKRLGYVGAVHTSHSHLRGLTCLLRWNHQRPGYIIKTAEFGLIFLQDTADLGMDVLHAKWLSANDDPAPAADREQKLETALRKFVEFLDFGVFEPPRWEAAADTDRAVLGLDLNQNHDTTHSHTRP